MNTWDIVVILIYLTVVTAVGLWVARKQDPYNFFVPQSQTPLWIVLFSLISTNVGAATFLGIASAGYLTGVSYGINATLIVVFGFLFLGTIAAKLKKLASDGKLTTMSQFFMLRYNSKRCHLISSILIVFAYTLFLSAQFRGLWQLLSHWTGLAAEWCIIIACISVLASTSIRGMKGDLYTDFIHSLVMFVGVIIILPIFTFTKHIGFAQLNSLPKEFFNPFNFAGSTFFFASILFGIPYLFASMEIWQRLFTLRDTSKSGTTSKNLFILAAIINAPMLLVPAILGLAERILNPNLQIPDLAMIDLIGTVLPVGLRGLATAAILAAILSTANSMLLVTSSTLAVDIFKVNFERRRALPLIRMITFIVGLVGVVFALKLGSIVEQLIVGSQMICILVPALLGGLFLEQRSESAAFYSIISGIVTFALSIWLTGLRLAFIPALFAGSLVFLVLELKHVKRLSNG